MNSLSRKKLLIVPRPMAKCEQYVPNELTPVAFVSVPVCVPVPVAVLQLPAPS